jgi:hypothetical protein
MTDHHLQQQYLSHTFYQTNSTSINYLHTHLIVIYKYHSI